MSRRRDLKREITRQPKEYGFDTGFVCHYRRWTESRPEDCGILREHLVLETLLAICVSESIHYWQDKGGREIDFVIASRGMRSIEAIECKWDRRTFSPEAMLRFREKYPVGANFVIRPQVGEAVRRQYQGIEVTFCSLEQWVASQGNRDGRGEARSVRPA